MIVNIHKDMSNLDRHQAVTFSIFYMINLMQCIYVEIFGLWFSLNFNKLLLLFSDLDRQNQQLVPELSPYMLVLNVVWVSCI